MIRSPVLLAQPHAGFFPSLVRRLLGTASPGPGAHPRTRVFDSLCASCAESDSTRGAPHPLRRCARKRRIGTGGWPDPIALIDTGAQPTVPQPGSTRLRNGPLPSRIHQC